MDSAVFAFAAEGFLLVDALVYIIVPEFMITFAAEFRALVANENSFSNLNLPTTASNLNHVARAIVLEFISN